MTLDFDLQQVQTVEFGVGRDDGDDQTFALVPVDADVQGALREVTIATWDAMQNLTAAPATYEPSEKYASQEYVQLALDAPIAVRMRDLHQAENMPMNAGAIGDTAAIFCYFARLTDKTGRRVTGLRRATQFKGVLKSRLIRLQTDALKIIDDHVFKLDNDFDLLIDSSTVHVLRPSGFEFVGKLREAILDAVPPTVASLQGELTFVDLSGIEEYASKRPRAARYLASIGTQKQNVGKQQLVALCGSTGVSIREENGKLLVDPGHEMGFLEVLDRRRYQLDLVPGDPERFRAASRDRLDA